MIPFNLYNLSPAFLIVSILSFNLISEKNAVIVFVAWIVPVGPAAVFTPNALA
jgi:hypothetical protein